MADEDLMDLVNAHHPGQHALKQLSIADSATGDATRYPTTVLGKERHDYVEWNSKIINAMGWLNRSLAPLIENGPNRHSKSEFARALRSTRSGTTSKASLRS